MTAPMAVATSRCKLKGTTIYNYTRDIPGADLDPALKPIIFPYIDLNLQTLGPGERARRGGVWPGMPRCAAVRLCVECQHSKYRAMLADEEALLEEAQPCERLA